MANTLYLECYAGISGDMVVAALLDLGAETEVLYRALDSLQIEGYRIEIHCTEKAAVKACNFSVILAPEYENHDHDMEYLHNNRVQEEGDGKDERGRQTGAKDSGGIRTLPTIIKMIEHADMTAGAKETAIRIFTILAEGEAKAHGIGREQVQFHEKGAVDTIVDIVAAAVCLDQLEITEVVVPKLFDGWGTIHCRCGILPIPVPAVTNIVQEYKIPLQITETAGELVTPTGAAIVAAIRTLEHLPEGFQILKTGVGAGKRDYNSAGILRAMLIAPSADSGDRIYQLETNIDDCSGEILGYVMQRLFAAGAKDVCYLPIFMKKNRPAYQMQILCGEEEIKDIEQILFEETTTIGIRRARMERSLLKRRIETIITPLGEADVKICTLPNGKEKRYPEYESTAALAAKNKISFQQAYDLIKSRGEENGTKF